VIDYDREASSYDETRGGSARAAAVASAVAPLLKGGVILDVACGTGIVSALLAGLGAPSGVPARGAGFEVLGTDRSPGMLAVAAARLPGRVLLGDATRLPVGSGSVDTVLMVWLLHLLDDATPALEEALRVRRPGGRVITTVDKSAAYFAAPSDLASVTAPWRVRPDATDRFELVAATLRQHGLHPVGESTFPGIGQGRSPRRWREVAAAGRVSWALADPGGVDRALAGLPDQDRPRPEPVYRLVAFSDEDS
jgi:SAM-dependent methyltransferase